MGINRTGAGGCGRRHYQVGGIWLGNVGVKVDSDTITNPNGCSNTTESTKLYKMIDTTDHGENMLSILLSAKISDATVNFI